MRFETAKTSRRNSGRRLRFVTLGALIGCALALGGCDRATEASPENEDPYKGVLPAGWPALVWPADNPYSRAKVALGRQLFFDFDLSRDRTVSCAWCHSPATAFSDNHHSTFSSGVRDQLALRNTPTLANMGFARIFTLDGKAASLEAQALLPLFAAHEMDMDEALIKARIAEDPAYDSLFQNAFGESLVTLERVTQALATYERTLISYQSPYDRWQAGDSSALSPEAKRGAALFFGSRLDCRGCHAPPLFTDGAFHNIGLDSVASDPGRAAVTGLASDQGRFKTPTLRNITLTPPYMHDGRFADLTAVLNHYNRGGAGAPGQDARIRPLNLTAEEIADLAAFLESLGEPDYWTTFRFQD